MKAAVLASLLASTASAAYSKKGNSTDESQSQLHYFQNSADGQGANYAPGSKYVQATKYVQGTNYAHGTPYDQGTNYAQGKKYVQGTPYDQGTTNYAQGKPYGQGTNYAQGKKYVQGTPYDQGTTNYAQGKPYDQGTNYAQGQKYVHGTPYDQGKKYVHGTPYDQGTTNYAQGQKYVSGDQKSQHCVLTLIFQIPYIGDKLQVKYNDKPVDAKKQCWWINKPADAYSAGGDSSSTTYTHPTKFQPNVKAYQKMKKQPKIDPNDPRFNKVYPRAPGDSRSACPGLNALANHDFIPHSGKGLTMTDLVVGCYEGLGISPETAALIAGDGLSEAKLPYDTVFNLEDFHSKRYGIEHDVSFSRNDTGKGDLTILDDAAWDLVLNVLDGCGYGSPACWGKAKVARIHQEKMRFPDSDYDKEAAAYGSAEVGMLLGAFDPAVKRDQTKECIKVLFEEEKIVCKPDRLFADFEKVTATGVFLLASDKVLQNGSDGKIITREDVLAATGKGKIDLEAVVKVLRDAGFTEKKPYENLERLMAEERAIKSNNKQKNGDHY
ncbi:hypothetical protein XA68_11624 [Ophiocordyceps unilateralis]|uniref:Heme haloperoxidase family profile domain-containing protein n=1 Tax=Ophiocordyceps unilateralis TaxID=268505 RepID=A0A2A9PPM3_OPHUN|nr:hypothetical protein XA68_11624 [Ophiocordyceps unilateralis]